MNGVIRDSDSRACKSKCAQGVTNVRVYRGKDRGINKQEGALFITRGAVATIEEKGRAHILFKRGNFH